MDSKFPGDIVSRGHYPFATGFSWVIRYDNRLTAMFRVVPFFNRSVEGIHIHMDDLPAFIIFGLLKCQDPNLHTVLLTLAGFIAHKFYLLL
ncbi:hypothetical protein SDC9_129375 [bioreactor metagenome]|uniref:Uncharacterized protein n=1 Tax=bioreactor metagenome TaxID=1076179 RepID=A0A645CZB7_9ZZZZ